MVVGGIQLMQLEFRGRFSAADSNGRHPIESFEGLWVGLLVA